MLGASFSRNARRDRARDICTLAKDRRGSEKHIKPIGRRRCVDNNTFDLWPTDPWRMDDLEQQGGRYRDRSCRPGGDFVFDWSGALRAFISTAAVEEQHWDV